MATEFDLCLLVTFSATPFVVLLDDVVAGDVGTGSFDVKFCFADPPTDDSERVTGWLDANEVSCCKKALQVKKKSEIIFLALHQKGQKA